MPEQPSSPITVSPPSDDVRRDAPVPVATEERLASARWSDLEIHSLEDAILYAVVYADLFDYPLTAAEIHRYLVGQVASLEEVESCLAEHPVLGERLDTVAPYWFLAGREHVVELRRRREAFSQVLWRAARRTGRVLAMLPFVRMVAVTGSLSMNNAGSTQDDIDLLLVSRRGRVWFVRGEVLVVARLARILGIRLCPNYIVAEHKLELEAVDHFTAHELAQLVPVHGQSVYRRLLSTNAWLTRHLPNAWPLSHAGTDGNPQSDGSPRPLRFAMESRSEAEWTGMQSEAEREVGALGRAVQRAFEAALGGKVGDAIERWEYGRKVPRLQREVAASGGAETVFSPDVCKGHRHSHGAWVHERYYSRLQSQGLGSRQERSR